MIMEQLMVRYDVQDASSITEQRVHLLLLSEVHKLTAMPILPARPQTHPRWNQDVSSQTGLIVTLRSLLTNILIEPKTKIWRL